MFVITVTYTEPLEKVEPLIPAHGEWLDEHYASGLFLCSGPQVPRVGGLIITTEADRAEVERVAAADPFAVGGVATHAVTEFAPNRGQLTPAS